MGMLDYITKTCQESILKVPPKIAAKETHSTGPYVSCLFSHVFPQVKHCPDSGGS